MADLDLGRSGTNDPRPAPSNDAPSIDWGGQGLPEVAGRGTGGGLWLIAGGAVLLGLIVFLWLGTHRAAAPAGLAAEAAASQSGTPVASPPPAPPDVLAVEAASRGLSAASAPPAPAPIPPRPLIMPAVAPAPAGPAPAAPTPTLVVDLADAAPNEAGAPAASVAGAAGAAGAKTASGPQAAKAGLNANEQFEARVSGEQPDHARATMLRHRSEVVAQGSMIPAVLETALDSDLPGFARAVVTRDVRSFDGSQVLIPRGSRVIGEYRSAAAYGQSRAFVIWTRVLGPDGVSIQIGSPATDTLGRAGLSGTVNTHFFEQFGSAILLSVVDAGATRLGGAPSTQVVIGSSQDATGVASSLSGLVPPPIPPTIKVPQGTPIRIFVARDLDFSPVGG